MLLCIGRPFAGIIFYHFYPKYKALVDDAQNIQWCPDISPGPVQPDNGTILGVGHKTVLLPLRRIWLK